MKCLTQFKAHSEYSFKKAAVLVSVSIGVGFSRLYSVFRLLQNTYK